MVATVSAFIALLALRKSLENENWRRDYLSRQEEREVESRRESLRIAAGVRPQSSPSDLREIFVDITNTGDVSVSIVDAGFMSAPPMGKFGRWLEERPFTNVRNDEDGMYYPASFPVSLNPSETLVAGYPTDGFGAGYADNEGVYGVYARTARGRLFQEFHNIGDARGAGTVEWAQKFA